MQSFDVCVIGAGVAGTAAALAARQAGATVAVIRAAPGATAVSSGAWDGPLPDVLAAALDAAGLPHLPSPDPLPHAAGDMRSCSFAAAAHVAPAPMDGALLCGIAGLSGFVAPALARLYAAVGAPPIRHATITLDGTPPAGWAPHALAAALEKDPSMLNGPLRAALPADATHVLMPAVLGLLAGGDVRARVGEAIGVPVVECLGAPPSIPGWRLDRALMTALRAAGVQVMNGRVGAFESAQHCITHIHVTQAGGGADVIEATRFVLATGKFLGGGIATQLVGARDQKLAETALGLPVWIDHLDQTFTTAESLTLTSRVRTYDQPMLRAGVHTNALYRPVDGRDRILYTNLIAVGAVRADIDANQLGLGFAADHAIGALTQLLSTTTASAS